MGPASASIPLAEPNKTSYLVKKIIIAIDGFSSCGKSTLAKGLALRLGYGFVDSGAMYRAVTLFLIQKEINLDNLDAVKQALTDIKIRFVASPTGNRTYLNDEDVEEEIRSMKVSSKVSLVAAIPIVRKAMVHQQQEMGKEKGIVMDGRDIGTVVFPQAELKLFVTADPEVRTQRRFLELQQMGQTIPIETVRQNLLERDSIDSNRLDSPLRQAEDALLLDNTNLTPDGQLALALEWAMERMEG